eukprot:3699543-Rhodomonas_salina.1
MVWMPRGVWLLTGNVPGICNSLSTPRADSMSPAPRSQSVSCAINAIKCLRSDFTHFERSCPASAVLARSFCAPPAIQSAAAHQGTFAAKVGQLHRAPHAGRVLLRPAVLS